MLRQIRKTTKNHPLDVAKKYVETYSSSNAAAQDPEERVQVINIQKIHYKINSLIQKLHKKKKIERTRRLTDLEWPKSPAQSLHTPSTSHNNPRTSQPCRQNNNFRLIIQTSEITLYTVTMLVSGSALSPIPAGPLEIPWAVSKPIDDRPRVQHLLTC